jgi:DNA-binding MarR family transcriptional regulator
MSLSSQTLIDEERVESELKGNTLRVYWHLLRSPSGSVGVRQTQKELAFSSPTLASYHLRKLEDLGLVREERGEYRLVREVRVGVLKQFTKLGTVLLPRYTLYATMFTTLLVYFLFMFREVNLYSMFALIFGSLATGIMWFETIMVWRQKP